MTTLTKISFCIFGMVVGFVINVVWALDTSLSQKDFNDARFAAALHLNLLHRLKIGEFDSVIDTLELELTMDARNLDAFLSSDTSTQEQKDRASGTLRVLSVMNEKFEIEQWRSDHQFLLILKRVQEIDPEHTRKLRCFNWDKVMWEDTNDCV